MTIAGHAVFEIDAGEPVRLREVTIEIDGDAASDAAFQSSLSSGRPVPGEIFDHGRYSEFKASVLRAAVNKGFFDADFETSKVYG